MDGHLEELLAFYALGGLTDAERAQVEAYVASNPEAKSRLEAMIQTTSALAYEAAPVKPPAALKKTLMDRVNADARTRSASVRQSPAPGRSRLLGLLQPRAGNWLPHAVAALSLLVALGAGGWALSLSNEIARLQTETNALRQELAAQRRVLAQLAAPNAQVIAIAGTEHQPGAHGQLIADSQTGSAVLVVAGLRPLGSGNVYQFWLIRGNTPVGAGLFRVDEQGQAILQVTQNVTPSAFNAIGVSIEPEGGSDQPTGDIVMLGNVF